MHILWGILKIAGIILLIILGLLLLILMIVLFALPQAVLADDGGQGDQSGAAIAERTIMLYLCGSDLEGSYGMGTHNLEQILSSSFSAEGKVRFIVLTGGSKYWGLDSDHLYGTDPIYDEPVTQISKRYNQLWEAKGIDAEEHPGQMVLIDGNGITGADGENVRSEDELMSDPKTLRSSSILQQRMRLPRSMT